MLFAYITVQFQGAFLGLIPGTCECPRMFLRLVKSIYALQVNYITDQGCCRLPLDLVVPSISLGGQRWLRERFPVVHIVQSQVLYVVASTSNSERVTKHRQRFRGTV